MNTPTLPLYHDWQGMEFTLPGELVIYRPDHDSLFVLNNSAKIIWQAWRRGADSRQISRELASEFGVNEELCHRDIQETLERWQACGLTGEALTSPVPTDMQEPASSITPTESLIAPRTDECSSHYYCLHDFIFKIQLGNSQLEKSVHRLFVHLETTSRDHPDACYTLLTDGSQYQIQQENTLIISTDSSDKLAMLIFREVTRAAYRNRENLLVIHGAAVASGGQCVVMPGAGGSGKSTLTAALIQRGLTYLSDDVVPIDRNTHEAIPLPICLNLKAGSLDIRGLLRKESADLLAYSYDRKKVWYYSPPGYNKQSSRHSYPVKCLVFPQYRAGVSTTIQSLTPGKTLQYLVESQSVLENEKDYRYISELLEWLKSVPAFGLEYESLTEASEFIESLLAGERKEDQLYG